MRLINITLIAVIFLASCKPQPTPQQQIQGALENLLALSPSDNAKLAEDNIPISWKVGMLSGDTLAATAIYHDHAEITFDLNKINSKHERLEPVIAHELDHVHDAYKVFGVDKFISIAESEKNLPWKERTLEKSALIQEDATREFLLKTYPSKFKGMASKRAV